MLRNFAYGGLALVGGAITGIAISSWAAPRNPPQVTSEVVRVASITQPATLASTSRVADDGNSCSPWDVSDVAMEAALNEMIRRGWRPPSQAEIVEAFDAYGEPTVESLEPQSLVPVRRPFTPSPSSEVLSNSEGPFPIDETAPTSAAVAPQAPTTPAPAEPPIAVEEPTPPSH